MERRAATFSDEAGRGSREARRRNDVPRRRTKRFLVAFLLVMGLGLLRWAGGSSAPRDDSLFALRRESVIATKEITAYAAAPKFVERLEIALPGSRERLATAIVAHDDGGRMFPLQWRNDAGDAVFFDNLNPEDDARVLATIQRHVPADAVVLAWWDFSRRIRAYTGRRAPLDDPKARGLLVPPAWASRSAEFERAGAALWGDGLPARADGLFDKFIEALLADEAHGADALREIAGAGSVFVAVRIADMSKLAAARPGALSIAHDDLASVGGAHADIAAVRELLRARNGANGYAVEAAGAKLRVHHFARAADSQRLLARLLPFSTSNPLALERFRLVYQFKGYWVYEMTAAPQ
jgi:hydroxylamine oxidation protein HaoB